MEKKSKAFGAGLNVMTFSAGPCDEFLQAFTSWRECGTEVPYHWWTNRVHLEAVCKPQQKGLQLPPSETTRVKSVGCGDVVMSLSAKKRSAELEKEVSTDAPHPLLDPFVSFARCDNLKKL